MRLFDFRRDHIIGTSLDLIVGAASRADAEATEAAVLEEIARLTRLLSTYDETSEISRLNRSRESFPVSPELFGILRLYQSWSGRTNSALTPGAPFALNPASRTARRTGEGAEDMKGHLVKNIALLASKPRYLNDLRAWYAANSSGASNWRSVARPTRGPGRYAFSWDGLDERGIPVPRGSYRISVECVMEHGDYYRQSAVIACMDQPAAAAVKRTGYFDEVSVQYSPKGSRA